MRPVAAVACLAAAALGSLVTGVASADEPPLPPGAKLRGTIETDAIREVPELKGARINRMRDESVPDVRALDQTWDADLGYREAVRFYDRAFAVGAPATEPGAPLLIEREEAATTTGWLVRLEDGTVAHVTLRNTRPTTIEIQRMVR